MSGTTHIAATVVLLVALAGPGAAQAPGPAPAEACTEYRTSVTVNGYNVSSRKRCHDDHDHDHDWTLASVSDEEGDCAQRHWEKRAGPLVVRSPDSCTYQVLYDDEWEA